MFQPKLNQKIHTASTLLHYVDPLIDRAVKGGSGVRRSCRKMGSKARNVE